MKREEIRQLYLLEQEFSGAVDEMFAAMHTASIGYIAVRKKFTLNIQIAWNRYVKACEGIDEFNKQQANKKPN